MAAFHVAAALLTSRKSCSTTASPPDTVLRERGHLARAARRASAPLAAGQVAPHSGLMWFRNDSQALETCSCLREEQGPARALKAVRPLRCTGKLQVTAFLRFRLPGRSCRTARCRCGRCSALRRLAWKPSYNGVCWRWRSGSARQSATLPYMAIAIGSSEINCCSHLQRPPRASKPRASFYGRIRGRGPLFG